MLMAMTIQLHFTAAELCASAIDVTFSLRRSRHPHHKSRQRKSRRNPRQRFTVQLRSSRVKCPPPVRADANVSKNTHGYDRRTGKTQVVSDFGRKVSSQCAAVTDGVVHQTMFCPPRSLTLEMYCLFRHHGGRS